MSLRFVIGRAGSGKYTLFTRSARRVKAASKRETILYLVPEQMTFQTQQALIGSEDVRGSIRAQVLVHD